MSEAVAKKTKLVIVESPAKAKTIGKMLGSDYVIKASMGHVRDLPERAFGVDIENNFQVQYEENKSRGRYLSDLKSAARAASEIYLAPDPDREGEAIAWHLQEVLGKVNKKAPFKRVSFHEITKSAIARAFTAPGEIDMDLVNSQQARRVLDRIVGYQVSPLLWTRIERGVSAGRVQSVALRLVCEREREIQSFIPKEYWNFLAKFEPAGNKGRNFKAHLAKIDGEKFEIDSEKDASQLINDVRASKDFKVASIEIQPRKKYAAPPFITSTLQQAASSVLGSSASHTMRVAQQLYEGVDVGGGPIGLITYMRTDSVAVATEAQNACRAFVSASYGADYVPPAPNNYKSKSNAQGAHEAIRPTDVNLTPEKLQSFLDPQQLKLYTLIWRRFVASQMAPARQERTSVDVDTASPGGHTYSFRATATVTKFAGFMRAYDIVEEGADSDEDGADSDASILGALKQDENCTLLDSISEQKFTEPAPRFSEATLIKELETNGIGRPSTYATIVNTIQVRKYVDKEKGKLIPTDLGFKINDYLVASLPELFQVGFTASMENKLDAVEEGKIEWTKMLDAFYQKFSTWLHTAKGAGAPENEKANALIDQIRLVKNWQLPEKTAGKRAFDDRKFFASIVTKYEKDSVISGRQWEALLSLALKYESDLPELRNVAEKNGFASDLMDAEDKRRELEAEREQRRIKREEMDAAAPAQDDIAKIFEAMSKIEFAPAEKRRGRTYDDKQFFDSLKKQSTAGKLLSEKQIAALNALVNKYREQIPEADSLPKIGNVEIVQPDDGEAAKRIDEAKRLIEAFATVQKWAEPVKKGRRTYDDKEFVNSIAKQLKDGKILSEKQLAALSKMADKYSL